MGLALLKSIFWLPEKFNQQIKWNSNGDILLKKRLYKCLFCNHTCYCVGVVSVKLASCYVDPWCTSKVRLLRIPRNWPSQFRFMLVLMLLDVGLHHKCAKTSFLRPYWRIQRAKGSHFYLSLHLHPHFVYASRECSCESVHCSTIWLVPKPLILV